MKPVTSWPDSLAVSIVVCTYNRADVLRSALETLRVQYAPLEFFEIIVVDNNSTDATPAVVEGFQKDMANLRYCFEPEQGLSHARNRGWREAKGEYVAYVDDDCRMPVDWLGNALNVIERAAPAAFGGPYKPWYQTPPPEWVKETYFSTLDKGDTARALGKGEYLSGGNFFAKREILEWLGGFDSALGMQGDDIGTGEETRLQIAIRDAVEGSDILYDPALVVEHLVRLEKIRPWWLLRHRFQSGRYSQRVFSPETDSIANRLASAVSCGKCLILFLQSLCFGTVLRDRRRFPSVKNYFFEETIPHVIGLGRAWERLLCHRGR